jgi:hypothetical protein
VVSYKQPLQPVRCGRTFTGQMSHPEIEKIISELREWCDMERGRRVQIAKMCGVSRQLVNDWFNRKTDPMAETLFNIRDFLKTQRRRKAK